MTVSAGVESLSSAYEEAELRIIDLIASRLKKGAEAPDWAVRKLQELALTKRQIEKVLNKLAPEAVAQVSQLLRDNYERGQAEALDTLIKSKMATPYPGVIQASKEMSKLLSETTQSILESHNRILRSTDDAYRKIVSRAASDLLLGTGTRSDMIQRGLNEFADKGITGFVDKRGRNWEMQAYVEMAAGTAAHRASTQGHLEKLKENGHNLVVVSDHKGECDQCRKWEGEVLAIEPVQDTPEPTPEPTLAPKPVDVPEPTPQPVDAPVVPQGQNPPRVSARGKDSEFLGWAELSKGEVRSRVGSTSAVERTYTPNQREALAKYTSGEHFADMKEAWKNGKPFLLDDGTDAFKAMEEALEATHIAEDTQVVRSLRMPVADSKALVPGSKLEHGFYISTTSDLSKAKSYGLYGARKKKGEQDVVLQIKVAGGTRALPGAEGLNEVVFSPNSVMHVTKAIDLSDGRRYIEVELEDA